MAGSLLVDEEEDEAEADFVSLEDVEVGTQDREDVIYLSHHVLSSINKENREKFSAVIAALNAQRNSDS